MSTYTPPSRLKLDRAEQYAAGLTIRDIAAAAGVSYGSAHDSIQGVVIQAARKASRGWAKVDGIRTPEPDALPPLPEGMDWYAHDTGAVVEWRALSVDIVRWALAVLGAAQADALFVCAACGRAL